MQSNLKWSMALPLLLAVLLYSPLAWGQLRTHSGARSLSGAIQHPKNLEHKIFLFTNEARRQHGLPALDPDDNLKAKAREKCDDMLKNHYFSHTSPGGKTFKDRITEEEPAVARTMSRAGENIYMGARFDYAVDLVTQARLIVDGWMTSPGHRRNMLDPNYTHMGIGVAARGKECYATQIFAQERRRP
jgi:uncharacterized protein YkwD